MEDIVASIHRRLLDYPIQPPSFRATALHHDRIERRSNPYLART